MNCMPRCFRLVICKAGKTQQGSVWEGFVPGAFPGMGSVRTQMLSHGIGLKHENLPHHSTLAPGMGRPKTPSPGTAEICARTICPALT